MTSELLFGICKEILAGTTVGRQALVSNVFFAPFPLLCGLPFSWISPRLIAGDPQAAIIFATAAGAILSLANFVREGKILPFLGGAFLLAMLALCGAPTLALFALLLAATVVFARRRGLIFLGVLPALYALAVWFLLSRLIMLDPLYPFHGFSNMHFFAADFFAPLAIATPATILGAIAIRRGKRDALFAALATIAADFQYWLLESFDLAWASAPALYVALFSLFLTLIFIVGGITKKLARIVCALAFLGILICPRQNAHSPREAFAQTSEFLRGTPNAAVFACGTESLAAARDFGFIPVLDLDIVALRRAYHGNHLFLLVPRPVGETTFSCMIWRYGDLYHNAAQRALFAADFGDWRLFEIIEARADD